MSWNKDPRINGELIGCMQDLIDETCRNFGPEVRRLLEAFVARARVELSDRKSRALASNPARKAALIATAEKRSAARRKKYDAFVLAQVPAIRRARGAGAETNTDLLVFLNAEGARWRKTSLFYCLKRIKLLTGEQLSNALVLRDAGACAVAVRSRKTKEHRNLILPVVKDIRAAGAATQKEIAEELNAKGYRTRIGCAWSARSVKHLLRKCAAHQDANL